MQDPMTLLFIIVIVLAVVAFWMMDTSRRAQAAKNRKLLTEARERADHAEVALPRLVVIGMRRKKRRILRRSKETKCARVSRRRKRSNGKSSGSELVTPANEDDGPTQHLRNQLEIVADELEGRVQRIARQDRA